MGEEVGRVKREACLDCGARLIISTEMGKGGRHLKISIGMISIGFDRPSIPRYRMIVTAEVQFR